MPILRRVSGTDGSLVHANRAASAMHVLADGGKGKGMDGAVRERSGAQFVPIC
jgi:hypothetical protein